MQNKKLKQAQEQENQKAQFLNYIQKQDKGADYIDMITSKGEQNTQSDTIRLEAMVRAQLKKDFPQIEKMKSYELLVDTIIHNYKKKQLQTTDGEID